MGERPVKARAVFLDRDGVLVRPLVRGGRPFAPAAAAEMELLADARGALAVLKQAGFLLIVVSNQPEIARGTLPRAEIEEMNRVLAASLPLDGIRICPHDDRDRCPCRKPLPGLLEEAAREHAIELSRSYMIGDRWRDVDAGRAAGCRTILIDRGYDERPPSSPPDASVKSLGEAAAWIVMDCGPASARAT